MARQTRKTSGKSAPDDSAAQQQIIDAAMRLAALQGWADTTMSDIAQEAGVELATLRRLSDTNWRSWQACSGVWTRRC